jgi:enterochelin esterase-like enzyme
VAGSGALSRSPRPPPRSSRRRSRCASTRAPTFAAARAGRLDGEPIWIDGGGRDPFHDADEAFVATMRAHGARVAYHVWPGGHDAAYWHGHLAPYLRFYACV